MIPTEYTDINVSELAPRTSDAYVAALYAFFSIYKIVAIVSVIVFLIAIVGVWHILSSTGVIGIAVGFIMILMKLAFLTVLYNQTYGSVNEKIAIFEKGKRIEATIIKHETLTRVRRSGNNISNTDRTYKLILQLLNSNEEITLSSQFEALLTHNPEGNILVGIEHNGQFLFGEDKFIHFTK